MGSSNLRIEFLDTHSALSHRMNDAARQLRYSKHVQRDQSVSLPHTAPSLQAQRLSHAIHPCLVSEDHLRRLRWLRLSFHYSSTMSQSQAGPKAKPK